MKKLALVLIGLLAFTTAQAASNCHQYADLAEKKVLPPYPNYFGAGEEYFHAAECYSSRGMTDEARGMYVKSANYYEEASKYLVEGGDYKQAGESHEKAGIAYRELGETSKAIQSYEKALGKYQEGCYTEEAERVESKITALKKEDTEEKPQTQASTRSLVGLASLTALFVSLAFLIVIAAANFPTGKEKTYSPSSSTPLEGTSGQGEKTKSKTSSDLEEIGRQSQETEKTQKTKKKSPEERAIRKLREKYKPEK